MFEFVLAELVRDGHREQLVLCELLAEERLAVLRMPSGVMVREHRLHDGFQGGDLPARFRFVHRFLRCSGGWDKDVGVLRGDRDAVEDRGRFRDEEHEGPYS